MSRRNLVLIVAAIVAVAIVGPFIALFADSSEPEQPAPLLDTASIAAKQYLESHASPEGIVGKEIHFENQTRGLLIAAANADGPRVNTILQTTQTLLRNSNGTFAASVVNGQRNGVASVGDLLTGLRALLVASDRIGEPLYRQAAMQLATQLLNTSYIQLNGQYGLLANNSGEAIIPVSAEVFQPRTYEELFALTGDPRWTQIAAFQRKILKSQMDTSKLPAGKVEVTIPNNDAVVKEASYDTDSQSIPLSLEDSCDEVDREFAKSIWQTLRLEPEVRVATKLTTAGKVIDDQPSIKAAVATAAVADVAGESVQSQILLDQATAFATQNPSEKTDAWIAIGRIVITTDWLGACE